MGAALLLVVSRGPESWQGRGTWIFGDGSSAPIREITALASLGFAFCYIASAPMLVLHAARPYLRRFRLGMTLKSALLGIAVLAGLFATIEHRWHKPLLAAGVTILTAVVGLQ